jgi:hypothetical protein
MAIAPLSVLSLSSRIPSSRQQASACVAKASFISTISVSSIDSIARASGFLVDSMGPSPMTPGEQPETAKLTIRARGVRPRRTRELSPRTRTAAAPSVIGDDVPAVTVPPALKAGFSSASFSKDVAHTHPSSLTTPAPVSTGAISAAGRPFLCAFIALVWLARAKRS